MIPRLYNMVKVAKGAASSSAAPAASSSSNNSGGAKGGNSAAAQTTANATQAVVNSSKATPTPAQTTPTTRMSVKVGDKTYNTNMNGKANLAQMKAMANQANKAHYQTKANTGRAQLNDPGASYAIASAGKASDTYDVKAWNAAKADHRARRSAARKAGKPFTEAAPRIQDYKLAAPKVQQAPVELPAEAINNYKANLSQYLINNKPMTSVPITNQGVAKAVGEKPTDVNTLTAQDYKNIGQHYNLQNLAYKDAQRRQAQSALATRIQQGRGGYIPQLSKHRYLDQSPSSSQQVFDHLQYAGALPKTQTKFVKGQPVVTQTYNTPPNDGLLRQAINQYRNADFRDPNFKGMTIKDIQLSPYITLPIGQNIYGNKNLAEQLRPIQLPQVPQMPAFSQNYNNPGTYQRYWHDTYKSLLQTPKPMSLGTLYDDSLRLTPQQRQIIKANRAKYLDWANAMGNQILAAQQAIQASPYVTRALTPYTYTTDYAKKYFGI